MRSNLGDVDPYVNYYLEKAKERDDIDMKKHYADMAFHILQQHNMVDKAMKVAEKYGISNYEYIKRLKKTDSDETIAKEYKRKKNPIMYALTVEKINKK